jgi:hypothetical protein
VALAETAGAASNGIAFLVGGGIVYEIIASNCSSPQTTELNASARAKTLMKWVHVGQVQAIVFIAAAAWFDRAHRNAILAGGILAMAMMEALYLHARQNGIANGGTPTEQHAGGGGGCAKGLAW